MRCRFFGFAALLVILQGIPVPNAVLGSEGRPNILFVLTDDQAPWALGISGHRDASTPNLDHFAGEGAYLPNCFVATPVCSPSRASLLTSRYGSELGITDWIKPKKSGGNGGSGVGLDAGVNTFPRLLAAGGYETCLIGKWHLGENPESHPTKLGYQEFIGFRAGGIGPEGPTLEVDGEAEKFEGLTVDILTDHAIEFLEKHREGPFLLSLHYRSPHAKWLPVADEDWAPFAEMSQSGSAQLPNPGFPGLDVDWLKVKIPEYLASVRGVDRNMGRLLAALRELDLEEDTVVIFTSDHGYNMGHRGIWHKGNGHWKVKEAFLPAGTENVPKGQRPNMWDNSLRVPALVRWPGVVGEGQRITEVVSNLDWFPTLLEIAGIEAPTNQPVRGRSIVPLLRGELVPDWPEGFYGEYSTKHQSRTHMRCYRSPYYKLVRDFLNPERDEFYYLIKDAEEATNLIGTDDPELLEVISDFDERIRARMEEVGDPVLDNPGVSL